MSRVLHALRDAIPPSDELVSAANHTAFEMADLLSVPHAWVPQTLLAVSAAVAVALLVLYACFPPAVRASYHIMVWSPWLIASLLLIWYELGRLGHTVTTGI